MLFQCWASIGDGGSALKQHYANVFCLLENIYVVGVITILSASEKINLLIIL